ncbi:hypothetical protein [Pseudomonas phage vB_PaeM-G11]|uniref:Uncharacterized protein n=1 Tax=Pseudomonas phage vB_PaeM-G11 TaxID=3034915 RepID=A0AAF0CXI9_9CAUD|nr:hypothetical protein [Pseudomonas sp. D3]WEM05636.1 hypothetical protein [Pseudomonas phage vB_PaeM-G11]WET13062.1 hypothetical protein P3S72_13320 [Pseudomonas sp. D3]
MIINLREHHDKKKEQAKYDAEQAAQEKIRDRAKQVKWPGDPE